MKRGVPIGKNWHWDWRRSGSRLVWFVGLGFVIGGYQRLPGAMALASIVLGTPIILFGLWLEYFYVKRLPPLR